MEERTLYARSGRVFIGTPEKADWVANVTELSASIADGNIEGTMCVDQVNGNFEAKFMNYINGSGDIPSEFIIKCTPEDTAPSKSTEPEEMWLRNVKFWSIPIGFGMNDLVTRDIDFTAEEDKGHRRDYTFRFVSPTPDGDTGVSNP